MLISELKKGDLIRADGDGTIGLILEISSYSFKVYWLFRGFEPKAREYNYSLNKIRWSKI